MKCVETFSDYLRRRWIYAEYKKNSSFCTLVWYNRSILFPIPLVYEYVFWNHKVASRKGKHNDTQFSFSLKRRLFQHLWEEARLSVRSMCFIFETSLFIYMSSYTQATVYITLHCIFSGDFIGSICISFYRSLGVFCYFTVPAFYGFQRRTKCCMCVNSSQVVYNNVQGDAILRKLLCGFDDNGLMWGVWWKLFLGWNVFECSVNI